MRVAADALLFSQACEMPSHHNIYVGQLVKIRRQPLNLVTVVSSDPLILDTSVLIVPAKLVAPLMGVSIFRTLFLQGTASW